MPRFVRSDDGVRIAYEVRGAGHPALVLVHGWSCDRGYWLAQLEALSREFLVVTLDLAGHGESDSGRREWSIAAFGNDVASVVQHLALEEVVLVGHSMGGDVILEAARRLPGLVDALVWVDTYRELPHCSAAAEVERRMAPFRTHFVAETRGLVRTMFGAAADPSLVERIARDMSAAPLDVALAALEAAWSFGAAVPDLLRTLGLPLIALNPADGAADIESLRRFGIEVVLLPGVGHFPMLEDPPAFNHQLANAARAARRRADNRRDNERPGANEMS